MFSGIIGALGEVTAVNKTDFGMQLQVKIQHDFGQNLTTGASIAVNGVCLTVVNFEKKDGGILINFDLVHETLNRSNLRAIQSGSQVNLERSLRFGDEIGGHLCSGHVDTTAEVVAINNSGEGAEMEFSLPDSYKKYILEKGFIALNGASITIARTTRQGFIVALIPEALKRTNLGVLEKGSQVNIEIDRQTQAIVETVERVLGKA